METGPTAWGQFWGKEGNLIGKQSFVYLTNFTPIFIYVNHFFKYLSQTPWILLYPP